MKHTTYAGKLVLNLLRRMTHGTLTLTMPDGQEHAFGGQHPGVSAQLTIHRHDFFTKLMLHGDCGFGESYVDGDWDTSDLTALISFMIHNHANVPGMSGSPTRAALWNVLGWAGRLLHRKRKNTRQGSQQNIAAHYDLSNALYQTFLDKTMTYSAAWFRHENDTLEAAQHHKYRQLCDKIQLRPGDHLLEIGCGWGGFSLYAATHFDCTVTAVTLSKEQHQLAQQRIAEAGLTDRITVKLCDYRDLQGTYDKIVSIEMLEAVGHDYLDTYFEQCHRLLKPEGVLGLQVITFPDARYDTMRRTKIDWIQKHIFPGGQLLSLQAINDAVARTGELTLHQYDSFGLHYAETLRQWRNAYEAHLPQVEAAGFDERFHRTWRYYLCYCEAGFNMRHINVAQFIYTRPNNLAYRTLNERQAGLQSGWHKPQPAVAPKEPATRSL